jgi:hypothetical protein
VAPSAAKARKPTQTGKAAAKATTAGQGTSSKDKSSKGKATKGKATKGTSARGKGAKGAKGKPIWKEVEEDEARRLGNRLRAARARRPPRRYAVVYDIDGPRVRLGIGWFLLALPAVLIGPLLTAVVFGAAAAAAGAQVARTWRRRRRRPAGPVAAAGAAAMAAGSLLGAGGLGLALIGVAVAACAVASSDTRSANPVLVDAGWTLQCAIPPGLAAASMVLLCRLEVGAAVSLLLLVSAYEIGDYLIGSGASNPLEGPAAGIAVIVVITFIISILAVPPFDMSTAWTFGVLVAVLAPLGQLAASAVLPTAGAPASALRRLDSLLLAGPVWVWGVGLVLQST